MELKDDFTNKYFRPDNIKSQMDLINQPTEIDAYADAFNSQANREAKGPAQRNSNALMAGLGAGLKGAANSKRQEQLSPILKMVGELNARSAYLEAQMQQEQQQKMTMVKFLRDNKSAIRDLENASVANSPEAQEILKYLSNKFEIATGQNPGKFNSFDTKQRKTFYDQPNGSTVGYGFLDAVEPYAEEAYGEETTDILQNLSPYHNKKYKEAEKIQNLKIEKDHADIANTNAQTGLYGAKACKTVQEMNNPPMTEAQKQLMKTADTHVEKLKDKAIFNKVLVETLNEMDGWIDEANAKGQVGSDVEAIYKRNFAKYYTGDNEAATLTEMAKQVFFNRIKEASGSNPSTAEFNAVLETIPICRQESKSCKESYRERKKNCFKTNVSLRTNTKAFL